MIKKVRHYAKRIKEGRISEIIMQIKWIYRYARTHTVMVGVYTLLGLTGTLVSLIGSLVSRDLVDIITGQQTGALLTTFC